MNQFIWSDPPSQTAFPIARPGYSYIFASAFITAIFALLELIIPALIGIAVTMFICWFFRDPDRVIPNHINGIVSPADGKIVLAEKSDQNPLDDGPCMKISIFMSIFNVHVNRISHEGTVKRIVYQPGSFIPADRGLASIKNEQNALFIETESGRMICVVQVAGWVARRIICRVQTGDQLSRGQRFGMICFGSRLDVYLPLDTSVSVDVGERVKAGQTILGYFT